MATFSSVTRQHVLQALAEYDARGGEEFLDVYGFEPSPGRTLVHQGRRYDCPAVLGVAHRVATGRLATPEEVRNGLAAAVTILRKRGFEVVEPASAARPPGARTARAPRTQRVPEVAPAICPTCATALPATGVCDYCS